MTEEYRYLLDVLAEVSCSVPDNRFIWCMAADGFATTVSRRHGLLLGGALSPLFLRDTGASWDYVPWTIHLWKPRVVLIEKAKEPLAEWIPLMEAIVKAGESLLLVTEEISSELLKTFIVNSERGTLECCAVRPADNRPGYSLPANSALGKAVKAPPKKADGLPKAEEAWIRRTATILFPASDDEWQASVSDVAIILVGGENRDDQQDRLRFLVRAIQHPIIEIERDAAMMGKSINESDTGRGSAPPVTDRDPYVKECLEQKFKEEPEAREWSSHPTLRKVLDLLNAGDNANACREVETLVTQFRDFADLYDWWGEALVRMGLLDKARQVLKDGLGKTKRKYSLCNLLGKVGWKARDISQAVYWWAQGLHCQESLSRMNYGGSEGAYLYLHYVAEGLALAECSAAFLMRVDQIGPGMIRLNTDVANDIISLARKSENRSIGQVLTGLVQKYIIPRKTSSIQVDAEELRRLILQLEEVASQSRWADKEKDVRAINRLAELGDPQAIVVLTRVAARGMLVDVVVAAEKAIDKIKKANR